MSTIQCFGCLNPHLEQFRKNNNVCHLSQQLHQENASFSFENNNEKGPQHDNIKTAVQEDNKDQNLIFFKCSCCEHTFCLNCCKMHLNSVSIQPHDNIQKTENSNIILEKQQNHKILVICQECQQNVSNVFCQSCQQYLCQKCSFKIHNKGKRAKHQLQKQIERQMLIKTIFIVHKEIIPLLKEVALTQKKTSVLFDEYLQGQLKIDPRLCLLYVQENVREELDQISFQRYIIKDFVSQNFKIQEIKDNKIRYPFINSCKIIVQNRNISYLRDAQDYLRKNAIHLDIIEENKKKQVSFKHQRVFSQKNEIKHHKNISNFSNVSAISKVEHQSVLSNEPSDLFQTNQASLNITLNQNSSILLMGNLSQTDKQEKQEKKVQIKEIEKQSVILSNHHRIYSIRQQNSHNSANNISSSTENSLKKRNKKWPVPYFQPFRIPKYDKGAKYNAELYLRQLAQKGILMIRREKAQIFLLDPDLTRIFTRTIGEKEIQYVSYIIQFLSIQCLAWVIESIKQDKMTPSEKLIQSRLKQSFDLKVNLKLWDSIIKYLQSTQYDQDYYQNTKNRYVPKMNVVKYGEQFLLQFQQRKWAYEDQQLLDQQEEEWKQFKTLITDYFHQKSQITGGRYGCVQYVKLNGPKPLRKCSLGKISLYVQEAINKGIIRYHKTVIVSNNENNVSVNSNSGIITDVQQLYQLQKELKIMALQVGLIDMFLQSSPNQPISMAQIPLNLKNKIMFQYNLVQLGFPKLKNLLSTISDKLVIQSTKTHTLYEATTNGLQLIQKLKIKYRQTSEHFISYIIAEINIIIVHYQSITIQDLYNQLTMKIGFNFDYKIFSASDFYQFVLYYCAHIITVQFIAGVFLAFTKYPHYHHLDNYQTHKITNSQQLPHSDNSNYYMDNGHYSKTTQKNIFQEAKQIKKVNQFKMNLVDSQELQEFDFNSINTPKFNNHDKKKMDSILWKDYIQSGFSKDDKANEDDYAIEDKFMEENINNILDVSPLLTKDRDHSASRPLTVIVNDGPQFNNNNQFYLQSKNARFLDEDSFSGEVWGKDKQTNLQKNIKMHSRVKSTIEPASKHSRMYSTTENRK